MGVVVRFGFYMMVHRLYYRSLVSCSRGLADTANMQQAKRFLRLYHIQNLRHPTHIQTRETQEIQDALLNAIQVLTARRIAGFIYS